MTNALDGIGPSEIERQHQRPLVASRRNAFAELVQHLHAYRDQDELVAMLAEDMSERPADPCRCAGDQRDRTHQVSSPPARLPATFCRSSMRSREETPSRSAALQMR